MPNNTLYDPRFEHDACGVGFVADISGKRSHSILETALKTLENLTHRGAVDADGKTGDGAGVLTQLPEKLFVNDLEKTGARRVKARDLAVAMVFLPQNLELADRCRKIVAACLAQNGLSLLKWRVVPVNPDSLGDKARATMPRIEQAIIGRSRVTASRFEETLYLTRRDVEREAGEIPELYVSSMSSRTIVYKGLFAGTELSEFYLDLSDPDYETALAVMHQRYSTNTFPNWFLAQPFRMVAQNGEINTLWGNRNWMRAREPELASRRWGKRIDRLKPVIWEAGSDSASLDNAMELIALSGRDLLQSVMMLIPEAFENSHDCDPRIRAFYEYSAGLMEPWDGPAAIAFSDGRFAGAALDRNGLRPARYVITNDNRVIMSSEAGAAPVEAAAIVMKGRLGPGQMLAVDVERGVVLQDREIKLEQARRKPYGNWLRRNQIAARHFEVHCELPTDSAELYASMRRFGYTLEDITRVLEPMLSSAKEPVGSMGDDTPLAVLSTKPRLLYSYFKQRFAQVTNPAIDPIRERVVMSLDVRLGRRGNLLDESPSHARLVKLPGPVLTDSALDWIRELREPKFGSETLIAGFKRNGEEEALEAAVEELSEQAVATVESGASILILSDRNLDPSEAPIPMLLAVAAVHHKLIRAGLRTRVSLIAETGEAREDHHFACLIGYGASAVNPYLAYQVVAHQVARRGMSVPGALRNYKTAVENGLLKIMAKMGISTLASYCGAQIFEAVGLSPSLIDRYFTGTPCRIGGIGIGAIVQDACRFAEQGAVDGPAMVRTKNGNGADLEWASVLEDAGFFRYRSGGEYHSFNPDVFRALHKVARNQRQEGYESYRTNVNTRPPVSIRDLLDFLPGTPIPKEDVEPVENILRRFSTSGMSHGALSREAHETLAIAMNRIGARSNSGEGGEATSRYPRRQLFGSDSSGGQTLRAGDSANSRIKQVASARFGVTPEYLMSASELEIKISQGSKPGEGGQLPGDKVSAEIAAIRHSVPGVTLISPPPHHDIYSIEDLAQLIYDLKQINTTARIAVKLVSEAGVGTVAAGVAKAFADVVHISGHDGGTGASPLGSIKNAGTSWELGLAESHQVLVMNGLRSRVKVRTDGGLKTGRDVVIAAMLGADEFGFATTALVALGCVMARQCHVNTCPVGIATQDKKLRERFAGKPEMVIKFFTGVAEEVREVLASLGFSSLDQVVGRADLLYQRTGLTLPRNAEIDLSPLLAKAEPEIKAENRADFLARAGTEAGPYTDSENGRKTGASRSEQSPGFSESAPANGGAKNLNEAMYADSIHAVEGASHVTLHYRIHNTDRTVGARIAGEVAKRYGNDGLPEGTLDFSFDGSAGQSFGAFLAAGIRMRLAGEANDYVGKSMAGGEIVILPPESARFKWNENAILGNTALYGATGGTLFAAGRAGERFAVRNSGASAVVEGVGDHGCEYMTAGTVVVLGEVGRNFAAGMTGGTAYVLDRQTKFSKRSVHETGFATRCNRELVELQAVVSAEDSRMLHGLIENHALKTGSPVALEILEFWYEYLPWFVKVVTQGAHAVSQRATGIAPAESDANEVFEEAMGPVPVGAAALTDYSQEGRAEIASSVAGA